MPPKPSLLEDSLGRIVHFAERALVNRLQRNFRSHGFDITAEQWRVLITLWRRDGRSQKELAEQTGKDKGSICRLIHSLEQRNLVVRIPDRADGRVNLIYLTPMGKRIRKDIIQLAEKTLVEAQADIEASDIRLCKQVLTRVSENLADGVSNK
jgi:DNA-binding MarR family transcriptional regulator